MENNKTDSNQKCGKYIEIDNINFSYGRKIILQNLSLTIPVTGISRLTGVNGIGKTTLLRVLGDVLNGVKNVDGQYRFLYVDRDFLTLDYLTVDEMIAFTQSFTSEKCDVEFLNQLLPSEMRSSLVHTLSLGQEARLVLAIALILPSDVLLLDEPFNGLDHQGRMLAYKIFQRVSRRKHIIFSTHENDERETLLAQEIRLVSPSLLEYGNN